MAGTRRTILPLEEVFKLEGIPTHTFVRPSSFERLLIALRTPRRCVVVEGPSGIGKTCSVARALAELNIADRVTKLSARRKEDLEIIHSLPGLGEVGMVIVDDFHKLNAPTKNEIADYAKLLAEDERTNTKLVLIGINNAGTSLLQFAPDLSGRIDFISFETEPDEKVQELVAAGERALNVNINVRDEIISESQGSFFLAQMLCHATCIKANILQSQASSSATAVSFETIRAEVWDRLDRRFSGITRLFAQGKRARPDGRAPYLHLLKWLAESQSWSIDVRRLAIQQAGLRNSVNQVIDKGHLVEVVEQDAELARVLHFEPSSGQFGAEDPQFAFYIRNLPWDQLARSLGYITLNFPQRYDVALSFAGADRALAQRLFELFSEAEIECFYDKNEQHRILASDVEEYLRPIYQSEAQLVVCLLGPDYPKKIWTKFESDQFKARFADGEVCPVWFDSAPTGAFDESRRVGGYEFRLAVSAEPQLKEIADLVIKKIREKRLSAAMQDSTCAR